MSKKKQTNQQRFKAVATIKKTKMKYNLNQNIEIKPTDLGIQLMVDTYNKQMPKKYHKNFIGEKQKLDDKGQIKMQFHQFLEYYGNLGLHLPKYVDLNIVLSEA